MNRTMTIGQRLAELAAEQELSQKQVAAELGVGPSVVSQWGSGSASNLRNTAAYARLVGWRLVATDAGVVVAEGEQLANLAGLREAAGLSQEELAEKLLLSPVAVRHTERRARPTMYLRTCQKYLWACSYRVGLTKQVVPRG